MLILVRLRANLMPRHYSLSLSLTFSLAFSPSFSSSLSLWFTKLCLHIQIGRPPHNNISWREEINKINQTVWYFVLENYICFRRYLVTRRDSNATKNMWGERTKKKKRNYRKNIFDGRKIEESYKLEKGEGGGGIGSMEKSVRFSLQLETYLCLTM